MPSIRTCGTFPDSFRGYKCRLARMLGIDYLVLDRPIAKLPRHVPRPTATLLYGAPGFYVYRLTPVVARAYLADRVKPIDNEQAIADHQIPEFDRAFEALVDERQTGLCRRICSRATQAMRRRRRRPFDHVLFRQPRRR